MILIEEIENRIETIRNCPCSLCQARIDTYKECIKMIEKEFIVEKIIYKDKIEVKNE